ncbi:8110_t:CDS:2 [Ambispora gerdemannii]|uniref:8110_t:CDS:1 n=1 Tax=Ambispora gerdemannii TaxID=144530 RepID=A0A9N8YM98_9GLOM|nr:8110_t:CDS:2 [Ambispora gerdemannii]
MAPNHSNEENSHNSLPCPILRVEDYDIHPKTGFLPPNPPLTRLPDLYYSPWEQVIDSYHDLMLAGRLGESINMLPILETDHLKSIPEYRRAFLILSILAHGFVWGKYEAVRDVLPACIAIPWVKVSNVLEIAPICNHAAVVLWNWRLIFPDAPFDLKYDVFAMEIYYLPVNNSIDIRNNFLPFFESNLATLITFTNTSDEGWFYLVTTTIEAIGGRALNAIILALEAVRDRDNFKLMSALMVICSAMKDINETLQRMFDKCDPYIFYWKVRPYLSGWENEDRLPKGLIYEGVDQPDEYGNPVYRQYAGGSAGQSALIQAIDIALNVEHYPTGVKTGITNNKVFSSEVKEHTREEPNGNCYAASSINSLSNASSCYHLRIQNHQQQLEFEKMSSNASNNNKPQQPYLHKIRQNIPGPHRRFLEDLAKIANIRQYILTRTKFPLDDKVQGLDDDDLVKAYNDCLNEMKNFRNKHLQIVSTYIVIQSHRGGGHFHTKNPYLAKCPVSTITHNTTTNIPITAINNNSTTNTMSTCVSVTHLKTKDARITSKTITNGSDLDLKGTGGTNLMPFLKQMRDETIAKEIGS